LDSSSWEEYCKVFEWGSRGPEKKPFK
jgi:hypothetical protein